MWLWGRLWHGREVKKGAVLYAALERRNVVVRRAIAFGVRHQCPNLPFAIADGVHDFSNPSTAGRFVEMMRQINIVTGEPVVLICIDTLSRALRGGGENSPTDMGAIVTTTARLQQETGAHVQWIHHPPYDGSDRCAVTVPSWAL